MGGGSWAAIGSAALANQAQQYRVQHPDFLGIVTPLMDRIAQSLCSFSAKFEQRERLLKRQRLVCPNAMGDFGSSRKKCGIISASKPLQDARPAIMHAGRQCRLTQEPSGAAVRHGMEMITPSSSWTCHLGTDKQPVALMIPRWPQGVNRSEEKWVLISRFCTTYWPVEQLQRGV
ncbi:hypothetical protein B0T22DRAFT_532267 [Podospora appendiculata]|uniref:Uncharacterized protein n=1 Tax=Podospora appendiculata TaxID=314037 RepID=A0AAE0XGI4_9PEZI|nr:hypothetical protein B0T22DRAFT_532267 [Podospora appendiculata]